MSGDVTAARLADVADVNPRFSSALAPNALVSFVPMSAVNADDACVNAPDERPFEQVRKGYTPFCAGDLLVAKITPCFENGKIAQATIPHQVGFGSTEFHVVRPKASEVDARYLLHFLRQRGVRRAGERRMTGSAGQRRVPEAFISELRVPLPPLGEQRRIAEVLDQAEALRAKRNAGLKMLARLRRSLFLDIIGDPAVNPNGWPVRAVGEVASTMSDGPFGSNLKSSHYTATGVRVIRLQNIGVGEFLDDDRAFVSAEHFASLRKHECRPGDVLVGTLGDPNLRACIQPQWLPVALNKADCVQIRVNVRVACAPYLCALLNEPSTERMAQDRILGQTRQRISMGRLREMLIPVPPLSIQREFAERSAVVDQLRSSHAQAATNLDSLFASLQHRAFRGEL